MSTAIASETRPQRVEAEDLILEEIQDELMIYDPKRNKAFCLNQTAAFVWKHADGTLQVSEIAKLMEQHLKKPASEQMVLFALDVLVKDGLLAPSTDDPQAPVGVTRRQVLRKMGAGAIALPVVTVLLVSPAKAHASSSVVSTPTQTMESSARGGGFWSWLEGLF